MFKPGRKYRIVVEGTPFHLDDLNTLNRTFVYQGRSFNISQTIRSSAELDHFFAGYQYDFLTGPKGHLDLSVEGARVSDSHHRLFEVEGDMRGMGFGSYGYYFEASGSGGVCIALVTFLARLPCGEHAIA